MGLEDSKLATTLDPPGSTLSAADIEQLVRFDEHWRVILADDNAMLVKALAMRGYFEVLKRRVPLYRLSPTGHEALRH